MRYKSLPLHVRSGAPDRSGPNRRLGPPPEQPNRLRDWIATAPVLILVVGLVIGQVAVASTPALHIEGVAQPGGIVMVHGQDFPQPQVQLWWDVSAKGMPLADVNAEGMFMVELPIPADAAPGTHQLDVTLPGTPPGHVRRGEGVLATASVTVESITATPTPAPSGSTPPSASPTPTPAPSHSHEPTPSPSTSPSPPPPGVDPVNCTGYPERRVFLEVQSWWDGNNTPHGMAHVHAGACFPLGQTVHGVMRLDTRITMHNNPGHLFALSTDLFTDGHGSGDNVYTKLNLDCAATCQYWVTSYIDTRGAQDGWHEFRMKPRVRHSDGRRQMTSSGWVLRTENGNSDGSSRTATGAVIGRGWYEGHGYQNPDVRSLSEIIDGPVSGTWTFGVRLAHGGQGFSPTFTAAYVDPDFHHGIEGWRVLATSGPYVGTLTIDTRQLSNGVHKLVLRVQAEHSGETQAGIMVLPFVVRN